MKTRHGKMLHRLLKTAVNVVAGFLMCMGMTPAHSDEMPFVGRSLTIGVVCPLTNSSKSFGIGHLQGVSLAAADFNRRHHDGPQIALRIVDDMADPAVAEVAIKDLVADGALAILGPCNSSVARGVLASMKPLPLPIVATLTTATRLTGEPDSAPDFFRMNVSDRKRMAALMVQVFSRPDRPQRITAFFEKNDAYGEGLRDDLEAWLMGLDARYFSEQYKAVGFTRDLPQDEIDNLLEVNAGRLQDGKSAVLLLGIASDAKKIIKSLRDRDYRAVVYIPEPESNLFNAAAAEGIDVSGVRVISIWDNGTSTDLAEKDFEAKFRNAYAEAPTFAAALAYDSASMTFEAVGEAVLGSNRDVREVRKRVADYLRAFSGTLKTGTLIVPGNHRMEGGELSRLNFNGLKFDRTGKLIDWDAPLTDMPPPGARKGDSQLGLPIWSRSALVLAIAFGALGSMMRLVYRHISDPLQKTWREVLDRKTALQHLLLDPIVAALMVGVLCLVAVVLRPALLEQLDRQPGLGLVLVSVIAGIAGILGMDSVRALRKKLGLGSE